MYIPDVDGVNSHFSRMTDGVRPTVRKRRRRFTPLRTSSSSSQHDGSTDTARKRRALEPANADAEYDKKQNGLVKFTPCRSVDNYTRLNFIDEGTYGRVFRARNVHTGEIFALKQVKLTQERDGFPVTSLREIDTLFSVRHPNVVRLKEVVVGSTLDKIYMVMEYAEHDLRSVLDRMKHPYSQSEIKSLMQQLLRGVQHLHDNWILHRDLKTSNLLLTNNGILKICDFGLARKYGDPLVPYSPGVVTLWYRAPEILLGSPTYTPAVDMWAVGCIFAELVLMEALIQGRGELDQLSKMSELLGSPREAIWPGFSSLPNARRIAFRAPESSRLKECLLPKSHARRAYITPKGVDLVERMLTYDPSARITASEALEHPFFQEAPAPKDPSLIQTFPDDRRR